MALFEVSVQDKEIASFLVEADDIRLRKWHSRNWRLEFGNYERKWFRNKFILKDYVPLTLLKSIRTI